MDQSEAFAIIRKECERVGYTHICPEALEALTDEANSWGWRPNVRQAYRIVIDGFRALLEPIGGWK